MLLFIVRHGKAERDAPTGRDQDRVLELRGVRQAQYIAGALAARASRPICVTASPVVRARQTAAEIAAALHLPMELHAVLSTMSDAHQVLNWLDTVQALGDRAIVGHNPTLSQVASHLLGPSHDDIELRTGECLVLRCSGGHGTELVESIRLDDAAQ